MDSVGGHGPFRGLDAPQTLGRIVVRHNDYSSIPAIVAVRKFASVPASIARRPESRQIAAA